MKLFLDASVMLAAAGSASGASRAVFVLAHVQGWELIGSPYVVDEAVQNMGKLPIEAARQWLRLRPQLTVVDDVVSLDLPVVFAAGKDRPILFTALASADVLLTLDRQDFEGLLGGEFYGMPVMLPYDFLHAERNAGRLRSGL